MMRNQSKSSILQSVALIFLGFWVGSQFTAFITSWKNNDIEPSNQDTRCVCEVSLSKETIESIQHKECPKSTLQAPANCFYTSNILPHNDIQNVMLKNIEKELKMNVDRFPGLEDLANQLRSSPSDTLRFTLAYLHQLAQKNAPDGGNSLDGWLRGNRFEYASRFVGNPLVQTVCEIGFNFGHSAVLWLYTNPQAHLLSFGMMDGKHTQIGNEFVSMLFPERFQMIAGDSTVEVPKYVSTIQSSDPQKRFTDSNQIRRCDVIHVDGGHVGDIPLKDLENIQPMAHCDTMVLMDDCGTCSYCTAPQRGWDEFKKRGKLRQIGCIQTIQDGGPIEGHEWCMGRFNDQTCLPSF